MTDKIEKNRKGWLVMTDSYDLCASKSLLLGSVNMQGIKSLQMNGRWQAMKYEKDCSTSVPKWMMVGWLKDESTNHFLSFCQPSSCHKPARTFRNQPDLNTNMQIWKKQTQKCLETHRAYITFTNQIWTQALKDGRKRKTHRKSQTSRYQSYQYYGHKWWKRGVEHKIPPVPGNNFDDNGGSVLVVSLSFASACLTIAKDCLLTGQEQACTRITWLFVWLVLWLSPCALVYFYWVYLSRVYLSSVYLAPVYLASWSRVYLSRVYHYGYIYSLSSQSFS